MKPLTYLLLTLAFIPSIGQPDNYRIGYGKNIEQLQEMIKQTFSTMEEVERRGTDIQWQEDSMLYIDTSMPEKDYQNVRSEAQKHRATLILDNTRMMADDPGRVVDKMTDIIGVGLNAPYVVITQTGDQPTITPVQTMKEAARQLVNLSTTEPNLEPERADKLSSYFPGIIPANPGAQGLAPYLPGRRFNIRIKNDHLTCMLYSSTDKKGQMDYCDDNASINVVVNVTQARSVRASDINGDTPDAKFVRFSVSEDYGTGAGIHLREHLIQENVWRQTNVNRHTHLGPYAQAYLLSITPMLNKETEPPATIRFSQPVSAVKDRKAQSFVPLRLGINSLSSLQGALGPRSAEQMASTTVISDARTLSWDTREYKTINNSTPVNFSVSWERDYGECRELVGGRCDYNTMGFLYDGPVFNEKTFSPVAYDRFVPNIDVVYEAAPEASGMTVFRVRAEVQARARYGRVKPNIFFGVYQPAGNSTRVIPLAYDVVIDWDHPLFEPEPHVRLRSLTADRCLQARKGEITAARCFASDLNQLWGLDSQERYRSRGNRGQCLSVKEEGTLQVVDCNDDPSQKWYWQDNQLISRFRSAPERWLLVTDEQSQVKVVPESKAEFYAYFWRNELTNIF